MTFWPMTLLRYVWPTPMSPVMIGNRIISPTNRFSLNQSCSGIASSMRSLSRIGLISPRRLVAMMATRTTVTWILYGAKKTRMRRMV